MVDGIYFSWDDENGAVALEVQSPPGQLCHLTGRISGAPEWLALNISLGVLDFAPGDTFGMAANVSGAPCTPYLRSLHGEMLLDTALQDDLREGPQPLLRTFDAHDGAIGQGGFHTLVLPLPRQDFTWALHDMAIFMLPAGKGLRSAPLTLSSFAS
ncbi:hypothetical protein [Sulfitobacter sp. 15WGC]|uniref:hypothetical protein n=1 Tax=Sulfitobacter sp. 15WGC TaxID=2575437 RepID=UPI0010ABE308|nr:hypothetical protein [Sulfitobacter sp. 15WGC]TKA84353.1 hypothetical protein FCK22_16355 [Sulfitobacter sp. 15WGC]